MITLLFLLFPFGLKVSGIATHAHTHARTHAHIGSGGPLERWGTAEGCTMSEAKRTGSVNSEMATQGAHQYSIISALQIDRDTEAPLPTREKEEGGTVRNPGGSTHFERQQVGSLLLMDGVMQTAS